MHYTPVYLCLLRRFDIEKIRVSKKNKNQEQTKTQKKNTPVGTKPTQKHPYPASDGGRVGREGQF